MKNKLVELLGAAGYVLYFIIVIALTFMPLSIASWHFLVDAILIAVVLFVPVLGQIVQFSLWAITLPMVITGPFDIVAVIYYVGLLIYLVAYVFPFVGTLMTNRKGVKRHTVEKMKKSLQKKPMYDYKVLEPFDIVSIDEITENNGFTQYGQCRFLGDTQDYYFYGFTPVLKKFVSGEYILRESKYEDGELVFFGSSADICYIFSGCIFIADERIANTNTIICRDTRSGMDMKYEWFDSPGGIRGHFIDHDEITDIYDDDDTMTIEVQRAKCSFHNSVEEYIGQYKLEVRRVGERFVAKRIEL